MTSNRSEPQGGPASGRGVSTTVLLIALLMVAFNLRPAATAVGPVLSELSNALAFTPVTAGLLTAMPVIMFGLLALATPTLARWFGLHRLALLSITVTGIGLTARAWSGQAWTFLLLSAIGLSGLAVLNVILPSLVKRHFADRVGMATALYTASMSIGLSLGALLTYPIASLVPRDGWRIGMVVWGITALVCIPLWMVIAGRFEHGGEQRRQRTAVRWRDVARTPLGWLLAAFFGIQSLQAYAIFGWFAQINRDAGFSASTASLLLATVSIASIPAGFVSANLASRPHLRVPLLAVLSGLYVIGYPGMIIAGTSNWAFVYAILLGVAQSAFPVVLALIGMKSLTAAGTAGLSSFTQSVGYSIAAIGPFGMGLLHDWFGSWTVALVILTAIAIIQFVIGWLAVRQPPLEEALPHRQPA